MVFCGKNARGKFWINVAQVVSFSDLKKVDNEHSGFTINLSSGHHESYFGTHEEAAKDHAELISILQDI